MVAAIEKRYLTKSLAVQLLYSQDRTVASFSQLVKLKSVSLRRRPLHDLRIMALKGVLAKFQGQCCLRVWLKITAC